MIIAIAHHKGGVGKTTLSLNLAGELKPDIVIDLDMHDTLTTLNQFREFKLPLSTLTPNNIVDVLNQDKLILIDCGGYDGELIQKVIAVADVVIVPVNDEINELIGLAKFDHLLQRLSEQTKSKIDAYILPYRIHPSTKHLTTIDNFVSKSASFKKLNSVIRTRKTFANCASHGLGVTEHKGAKYTDAAKEVRFLASEIGELIGRKSL